MYILITLFCLLVVRRYTKKGHRLPVADTNNARVEPRGNLVQYKSSLIHCILAITEAYHDVINQASYKYASKIAKYKAYRHLFSSNAIISL